jgi:hypothetical protein
MSGTLLVLTITFLLGVICLAAAAVLTLLGWRVEAPRSHYFGYGSDVAIHPERYVREPFLRVVRVLNLLGALLACVASVGFATVPLLKWLH